MKILHDVFPAFLAVAPPDSIELSQLHSQPNSPGSYQLTKTRVVVTDERVIVAHDGPQGPVIVFNEKYKEFNRSGVKAEDSHVVSATGKMLAYRKDDNCGCGSRLRAWNPYRHVYSSQDPTE